MIRVLRPVLACVLLLWGGIVSAETISQIKLGKMTKPQYLLMQRQGFDILEGVGDTIELLAKPADLEWFQGQGIDYTIEIPNVEQFYKNRIGPNKTMGGFRTFSENVAYLDSLHAAYPTITTAKFSIGTTVNGNPIWAMKISDNPDTDENETEMLYISLIHAREPAACATVLAIMNHFLSNYGVDAEITNLVNNRELYFIPMQNPDGYLYNQTTNPGGGGLWRKNRRLITGTTYGVDLNRNYDASWGFDDVGSSPDPSSEVYRGPSAFSELETQAVRDFTISRHFAIVHNYHTYSNLVLWSPGNIRDYSPYQDFFHNLGDSMTHINGYTPEPGWGLYPTNGGADDWHWGDTISKPRQISITTEIGNQTDGFWPSPARIPTLTSENIPGAVFLARIADNPFIIGPPVAPVVTALDSTGKDYAINWSTADTINPPVTYRILEMTGKSTVLDSAASNAGYWDTTRFVISNTRAHSGTTSWGAVSGNKVQHWLVSKTPYEVKPNDSLKFWIWYNVESNYDYFYAQISVDGGFSYINLPNNLTTNSDPNNVNYGNGITGSSSNNWVRAAYSMAAYAGQQVYIRLAYITDDFTLGPGVWIDDIENVDLYADTTQVTAAAVGTSYNFTNRWKNTYYYRITGTDAQNQESRFSNIKRVKVQGLVVGDCNNSGSVTISDVTFLVSFLFAGGAAPNPLFLADANCNGGVTITDLTRIINFLFNGGAPLQCP